jgi:hypothetical protein
MLSIYLVKFSCIFVMNSGYNTYSVTLVSFDIIYN